MNTETNPVNLLAALCDNPENLPLPELRKQILTAYLACLQGLMTAYENDLAENAASPDPENAYSDEEWFAMLATATQFPWKSIHNRMIGAGYASPQDAMRAIDAAALRFNIRHDPHTTQQ
jgi:hypothetical protein